MSRWLVAAAAVVWCACAAEPEGLDRPSAVVHDAERDAWLVANTAGAPGAAAHGYIARLRPTGGMERYWIRNGRDGVTLRAPAALALARDVLWVADVDTLRAFDRRSGAPRGAVPIPGATTLAGVAVGPDGTVWCTDSGVAADGTATGTDAIWRVAGGSLPPTEPPVALVRGPELGQPTAIVALAASVYVVNRRDGRFFSVDTKGRRSDLVTAPAADLTGLTRVAGADGRVVWFAASRAANRLFRIDSGGACTSLPATVDDPGAVAFDPVRGELLVPLCSADRIERVTP